jgi:hypothetical protein
MTCLPTQVLVASLVPQFNHFRLFRPRTKGHLSDTIEIAPNITDYAAQAGSLTMTGIEKPAHSRTGVSFVSNPRDVYRWAPIGDADRITGRLCA